jgi:CDP-diacylglycerol--serine O-phosphatidyltransferase
MTEKSTKVLLGRSRFLVPNLFTSMNFLLGVWSILLAAGVLQAQGRGVFFGAAFIVFCVLFDKLDGFAARLMRASSDFGAQFDSLADLVAFGLAPAFLTIFAYKTYAPDWYERNWLIVLVAVSLYALCAALRLARFNAIDSDAHPDYFVGLPSTFAGGAMALVVILFHEYGGFTAGDEWVRIPLLFQIAVALMMVSPFLLPKVKPRKNKALNAFQIVSAIVAYVCGIAMTGYEVLAFLAVLYGSVGFTYGFLYGEKATESSPKDNP